MSKKNIGSTIGVLAAVTIGATAYASTMNNLDKEDQSKKVLENNISYIDNNYASKVTTVKKDYSDEVKNTKFAEKTKKSSNKNNDKVSESRNLADPAILESSSEDAIVKAIDENIEKKEQEKVQEDTVSNAVIEEDKVEENQNIVVEKYVGVDSLNVRSAKDDTVNNVVSTLSKYDKVSGTIEDGWLKTESGYIKLDFLVDTVSEEELLAQEEAKKAEEAKAQEEAKKAEEAKAQEEAKKAEEAKANEEAKKAEEAKANEEAKKAEEAKAKEEANKVISYAGWVNTSSLNVRSNASANSNLLGALGKGEKVSGELQNGWLKISYNGSVAYVSADYLSDTEVAKPVVKKEQKVEEKKEEEKPQVVYYTGWVNTASLRVRSAANTSSNILGNVTKGEKLEGQLANDWLKITYNGQTGYVHASYLSDTEVEKPQPVVESRSNDLEVEQASTKTQQASPSYSASGQQVAQIASSFIGSPYVWGGSSPSGFDCSGLVYYAYKQVGITLNRNSAGQYQNGYSVSLSNLQPGDLVFFSYGGGIDHVAMITDYNGGFVHASTPSTGVVRGNVYDSWYSNSVVGAKRIF